MPGAADIRAGGAFVEIGIKDETRAALEAIRRLIGANLRNTAQQGQNALGGLNNQLARTTMIGGRSRVAFQQMAFAVEDAVTVFGTSGFSGAIRASTNNLTFLAAQMGSLKLQVGVMAAALSLQLVPALLKVISTAQQAEDIIQKLNNAVRQGAVFREEGFERSLIPQITASLDDVDDARKKLQDLTNDINRIQETLFSRDPNRKTPLQLQVETLEGQLEGLRETQDALRRFSDPAARGALGAVGVAGLPDRFRIDILDKLRDGADGIAETAGFLQDVSLDIDAIEKERAEKQRQLTAAEERLKTLEMTRLAVQERLAELSRRGGDSAMGDTPVLRALNFGTVEARVEELQLEGEAFERQQALLEEIRDAARRGADAQEQLLEMAEEI